MKMHVIGILVCSFIFVRDFTASQTAYPYPFRNPLLSIDARVDDLVGSLTLEEKIRQMQNRAPAIPRLGIPDYNWWNEALHGVARNGIATVFPQAIGMAATWDPDLIRREADVISTEARAKYNELTRKRSSAIYQGLTYWSPNINIFRDPRWGRGQETYGEDPFLTSRLGIEFVKGLQGGDPRYLKTISTPKHFAVHSGPELLRHGFDARPPKIDFYETYLPAFEACITEGGAQSVMGAYNSVYGDPCCASNLLLGETLRGAWKFSGYVVSDCGAIGDITSGHRYARSHAEASAMAVKAGCDLTCGGEYEALSEAVAKGLITESEIDRSVGRLMRARFKLGMFDPAEIVPYSRVPITENDSKENSDLARRVAQESIVLLHNPGNHLPLSKQIRSVAVIGPNADDIDVLLGNYNGTPSDPVTILKGIRNKLGPSANVRYARGCDLAEDVSTKPSPIPSRNFNTRSEGAILRGLRGEYFTNPGLSGKPAFVRIDSTVDFAWYDVPAPGIPPDAFSVRWTGLLIPDSSGTYLLSVTVNDGCRLLLNGSIIIDSWQRGTQRTLSKEVDLVGGKSYDIVLEFFDNVGSAIARLGWVPKPGNAIAEAVAAASASDEIIVVLGLSPSLEGEEMPIHLEGFQGGDRTDIRLPATQVSLVKALKGLGKPIVLVLLNGSALSFDNADFSAALECWYPGQQGGNAVADVLFGDYNPGGRLPVTFYRSVEDLPPFEEYAMKGRTYRYFRGEVLYPFGYGLSYTSFAYERIQINDSVFAAADTATVKVTVRNTGGRDGDEVVQLYIKELAPRDNQPIHSLKGFARGHFRAGETKTLTIQVPVRSLRIYDAQSDAVKVLPGNYAIEIGPSSTDTRLTSHIRISG